MKKKSSQTTNLQNNLNLILNNLHYLKLFHYRYSYQLDVHRNVNSFQ